MSRDPPLACDATAIPPAERKRHEAVAVELFTSVDRLREEPRGYRFALPADGETIRTAGAFISRERLCCPFLDFSLEVPGGDGPVWLELSGGPGVKRYLEKNLISRLEEL